MGRGGLPGFKDDDGKNVAVGSDGPPPLFPEITLPPLPSTKSSAMNRQLKYRHELESTWKNSTSHISEDCVATPAATDAAATKLTALLTLDPLLFPAELFSSKEALLSRTRDSSAPGLWAHSTSGKGDVDLSKLEELAQRESRVKSTGAEEPETGAVEDEVEEEDELQEDDDYCMNEHFDDDDGYEEDYGNGDEPAYY